LLASFSLLHARCSPWAINRQDCGFPVISDVVHRIEAASSGAASAFGVVAKVARGERTPGRPFSGEARRDLARNGEGQTTPALAPSFRAAFRRIDQLPEAKRTTCRNGRTPDPPPKATRLPTRPRPQPVAHAAEVPAVAAGG